MTEQSTPSSTSPNPAKRTRRQEQRQEGESPYRHRNRSIHVPDGHMAIGRIVGVHGLNGELRVELHTDFPERFATSKTVLLGEALHAYSITGARDHRGMILLALAEVTDRESAEALRDEWLFIPENEARALPDGEYWVHDIVGLTVVDETGREIGRIGDVLQTGANDVYIVAPADGINRDRELLIPAIADVVQSVDLVNGRMTIQLLPGLLEE